MSLRKAINATCKACLYDPIAGSGSWRTQILSCTAFHCPLYAVRPKPLSKGDAKGAIDFKLEKASNQLEIRPSSLEAAHGQD